jgi:Mg2+/Co2+ transporter CorB
MSSSTGWAPILDQQRITTEQTPIQVAVAQLHALKALLGKRRVIVLADRGYCTPIFLRACEELVGEIQSEYQARDEQAFVQREDGSWLVDGMVALDGVWERIGIPTPSSEKPRNYTTLAELILAYLGHIPAVGDLVTIGDVTLEVVDMDGRRIDRVLISRQK